LRQGAIPFAFAIAYALWDFQSISHESRTVSGFVKSLGIAFFLVMWFVGQWFRAEKQVSDEEQLGSIKADVAAIKQAVTVMRPAVSPTPQFEPIADPIANVLFREAKAAMDSGLNHSALLTAGVAFEHSLRRFSEARGVVDSPRLPVARILKWLRDDVGLSIAEDLAALWKVRNIIVHLRDEQLLESDQARQLLESFEWAIRYLTAPQAFHSPTELHS